MCEALKNIQNFGTVKVTKEDRNRRKKKDDWSPTALRDPDDGPAPLKIPRKSAEEKKIAEKKV